jgi:hypothetical protein
MKNTFVDIEGVVSDAFASVDAAIDAGKARSKEPIESLLREWVAVECQFPEHVHPKLRRPASARKISAAEKRLGVAFPDQLRELYLASDGIDWFVPPNALILPRQHYFPSCDELCTAGELEPALSQRILKAPKRSRPKAAPLGVRVVRPSALSVFSKEEQLLRVEDLDAFFALQSPTGASCLLLVQASAHNLPAGTVLDFESSLASRYDNLAHWLAAHVESEYSFCRSMGRDLPKPI